jgi:cytochrome d ubiquinol oxidase subunit II
MEPYKYLHNLIAMPIVLGLFLIGVVLVLWGIGKSLLTNYKNGIWFAGIGTILTVLALFLIAGYNNTAYYPSTFNLQSSLTIFNSSSSKFTLTVMSFVSLLVPFVIAYIWYVWKSMNRKQIDAEEMKNEGHIY